MLSDVPFINFISSLLFDLCLFEKCIELMHFSHSVLICSGIWICFYLLIWFFFVFYFKILIDTCIIILLYLILLKCSSLASCAQLFDTISHIMSDMPIYWIHPYVCRSTTSPLWRLAYFVSIRCHSSVFLHFQNIFVVYALTRPFS